MVVQMETRLCSVCVPHAVYSAMMCRKSGDYSFQSGDVILDAQRCWDFGKIQPPDSSY